MKKLTSVLLTLVALFGVCCLTLSNVKAAPALGTKSEDSPFFSAYMPGNFGIERVDDVTVGINGTSGWGQRGGFVDTFDIKTLGIKLNASSLGTSGGIMITMSSKAAQSYADEAATEVVMDIVRQSVENHNFLVTFSHSAHNTSVEGFGGSTFHPSYKGANLENVEDDIIDIQFAVVENVPTITVNGTAYSVPTAFDSISNTAAVNVNIGLFNENGAKYITASVLDQARRDYYGANGAYGKAKALVAQYTEALKEDLTVPANVLAAKAIRDQIDLSNIKDYDLPRLKPAKEANDATLQAALDALNLQDLTPVYEGGTLTYRLDKLGSLQFAINLFDLPLESVKIGEVALAAGAYSYADGKVVLTEDALKTLTAGNHEVFVTTMGGTTKVNLTVFTGEEFKPVTSTALFEYTLGNTGTANFNLDTKGAALTEVKIGEIVVSEYSYKDGVVAIANKVLELLDEGEYVVSFKTIEGTATSTLKVNPKPAIEDRVPTLGNYGQDVDWFSRWQGTSHGAVRTGVTEMKIITTAGWGQRGGFKTPFDITNLSISVDLSTFVNDTVLMILFSTVDNTYAGEGQTQLIIELVKISDTKFFVVFGDKPTQGEHCVSFDGFADGTTSDKPGYSGITVDAEAGVVNITLVQDADKAVKITVNGNEYTIANAYATVSNPAATFISLGTFLGSGASVVQSYKVNYLLDAQRKEYYSETGAFGAQNKLVNELKAAVADLSTLAKIEAAIAIKDQIDLSQLKAIDLNFVQDTYNKACFLLEQVLKSNPELLMSEATKAVVKLEGKVAEANTFAALKDALAEVEIANAEIAKIKGEASLAEGVQALEVRVSQAVAAISTKIKETVNAQYESFVNKVAEIDSAQDLLDALKIKKELNTEFQSYFTEEEWTAIQTSKTQAEIALAEKQVWSKEGWTVNDPSVNVIENNGEYDVLQLGGTLAYEKETLNAKNFTMKLNIAKLSTNTGSWLSFGLMTQPKVFNNIESIEVTENRGILFLITAIDETHANVQMYMITYMSSGFLTSIVGSLKVDITKELNIKFEETSEEVAGLTANYFTVSFNEAKFAEKININQVDVSLDDAEGYLYFATSGSTIYNPTIYQLKEVNGKKLDSESLKAAKVLTPPTSTDGAKEYTIGTTAQVSYQVNTYGKKIQSVKVGDKVLESNQYASRTTTFIIQNSFLKTLAAGKYEVVVTTEDGECKLELVVVAAAPVEPEPVEPTPKKGCFGTVAVSTFMSISTLCTALVVLLKKKQ